MGMLKVIIDLAEKIKEKGFYIKISVNPDVLWKYKVNIKDKSEVISITDSFKNERELVSFLKSFYKEIEEVVDESN